MHSDMSEVRLRFQSMEQGGCSFLKNSQKGLLRHECIRVYLIPKVIVTLLYTDQQMGREKKIKLELKHKQSGKQREVETTL